MSSTATGFIGLGLMGNAMAGRLLERGLRVVVYNRTRGKCAALQAKGAVVAETPLALARQCSSICLMVKDGPAVRELLSGAEGLAAGLAADAAAAPKTVINSSTVGIQAAIELAARVRERGADYLDAPVLGSIVPAARGELVMFAAGEEEVLERNRPLLDALARRVLHVGPVGQGSALKLIANMLLAHYVEALGEILTMSRAFGLSADLVLEAIQSSQLASPMWDKGKTILSGPAPLHFPLRHMVKDLLLLDEELERCGMQLPVQEAVQERFVEALQAGLGDLDYSELARPAVQQARDDRPARHDRPVGGDS